MLRFGIFEADLRTAELRKSGRKVGIQEQPFKILAVLLARPGKMVSREELRDQVWSTDTFIDFDTGLNKAVMKIREVLGDSADSPRFIETLPRRGYQFIAPVEAVFLNAVAPAPPLDSSEQSETKEPIRAAVQELAPPGQSEAIGRAPGRRRPWMLVLMATALAGLAGWGWWTHSHSRPTFASIAVLPLENLSGDSSQEFFADGITDELITELAKVGSLRVISRTSVMQYRRSRKPLPEIARELGVGAIVEGSVVRSGDRVRVTAQLIDAATDRHLWAQSYQHGLGDILALQAQVAQDIASHVNAKLTSEERRNLAQARPVGLEAHDSYLKGHLLLHDSPSEAVRYFEQAIGLDPGYAQAYAGLADAYYWPAWDWGSEAPGEAFPKGEAAALKALQLDPASAEGHAALGLGKLFYEWNWLEAESEITRAISLSPNDAWAHHHYARLLAVTGRFDDALRESRRMLELDPLDFRSGGNLAWTSYLARRYDESIRENLRMLQLHPSIQGFHRFLAWDYQAQGQFQDAIRELQPLERNGEILAIAELGFNNGLSGNQPVARAALEKLLAVSKRRYVPPYYIALVYTGLRNNSEAFDWLEKAFNRLLKKISEKAAEPSQRPYYWGSG